ncbi:MAG: hypothetical protein RIQ53_2046 [Pseudomonadota bacterium]
MPRLGGPADTGSGVTADRRAAARACAPLSVVHTRGRSATPSTPAQAIGGGAGARIGYPRALDRHRWWQCPARDPRSARRPAARPCTPPAGMTDTITTLETARCPGPP